MYMCIYVYIYVCMCICKHPNRGSVLNWCRFDIDRISMTSDRDRIVTKPMLLLSDT